MKCPNCGKWNQASLPHCIYCGQELPNDAYGPQGVPAWQLELEDRDRKNTYVRVDETGEQETTNDPRDTLASEMADLKSRKIMGEQKQRMLRQEAARCGMARPASIPNASMQNSGGATSFQPGGGCSR